MSANHLRGEIEAELDGRTMRLCLTLGALAELEQALGAQGLGGLLDRIGSGRLGAADMIAVIGAGLRGGGNEVSDAEVAAMRPAAGAAGFARILADLIAATFPPAAEEAAAPNPPVPQPACPSRR